MSMYFSSGNDLDGRMVYFSINHPAAKHAYMQYNGVTTFREYRLIALYNALSEFSYIGPDAASFALLKTAIPAYRQLSISAFKADLKMLRDMKLLLCTRTHELPRENFRAE